MATVRMMSAMIRTSSPMQDRPTQVVAQSRVGDPAMAVRQVDQVRDEADEPADDQDPDADDLEEVLSDLEERIEVHAHDRRTLPKTREPSGELEGVEDDVVHG